MSIAKFEEWFAKHNIDEIECLVPDPAGTPRGKILPARKFLKGLGNTSMRLPEDIFILTVTGKYSWQDSPVSDASGDVYLVPDINSLKLVPWHVNPTAQVICDAHYLDGKPVDLSPRYVLQHVLQLYAEQGWKPVVAPELEFYLVKKNFDADYPLEAPIGTSGRAEKVGQAYGIDAANEFDPIVEDIYDFCEAQEIDIDTISHESGPAQLEINFNHGDPLELADQVFIFKRTVRQAALKHDVYATFMAKPHQEEPGSSMHLHQSLLDLKTGQNLFKGRGKTPSKLFMSHVAGLQRYLPAAMGFCAPNVNSYRRLVPNSDAPTNTHWGIDNRTAPLRMPCSDPQNTRIENRVPGADANPYLCIAASLACGYLGMMEKLEPTAPIEGSAYRYAHSLPINLDDAMNKLNYSKPLKTVLGQRFVEAFMAVKEEEQVQYRKVISSWEREFLLLNV